jgi:hypothetical protein
MWKIKADVVALKNTLPECRERMLPSYLPPEADDA